MPMYCSNNSHCNMQLPFIARNSALTVVTLKRSFEKSKLPLLKNKFACSVGRTGAATGDRFFIENMATTFGQGGRGFPSKRQVDDCGAEIDM